MTLKLATSNTDEEIIQHRVDKQVLFIHCKSCGHRYTSTVGEMADHPECTRCKR